MVESTEGEGKEPSLSDLMSILQAHMGQQEAWETRLNEMTGRQEKCFKALHHQFQLLQLEVQARTSPIPDPQISDSDHNADTPLSTMHSFPVQAEASAGQFHQHHQPRLEKFNDIDDIEHI